MNMNEVAKQITVHEGLKVQVNIAQVKEILKVIMNEEDIAFAIWNKLTSKYKWM